MIDELNSRVGRVSSRPFSVFNWYTAISKKHGVLAAVLIGYLEYLDKTDPPSRVEEHQGVMTRFYRLPLPALKDDVSAILKAPMARHTLQRALMNLARQGLIYRTRLEEAGGGRDLYYAVRYDKLEEVLLGG